MGGIGRSVGSLFRPTVLALVAPLVLLELYGRVILSIATAPISFVVAPPVLGAVLFTLLRPAITAALEGKSVGIDDFRAGSPRRAALAGVGSVVVHGVAFVVVVAVFVLIDTPVRYLWYWSGGGPLSVEEITLLGIGGILVGVAAAWGVLATAVVRIGDGEPILSSIGSTLWTQVRSPKAAAVAAGVHLLVVGTVFVAAWVGNETANQWYSSLIGWAFLGVLIVNAVAVIAFHLDRADRPLAPVPTDRAAIRRVAVVVLLVTSLVVGASALRLTETRPIDTEPEPIPDDPTAAYAVALENTERRSVTIDATHNSNAIALFDEVRKDRENRRMRVDFAEGISVGPGWTYESAGTAAPLSERITAVMLLGDWAKDPEPFDWSAAYAVPGYWFDYEPGPVRDVLPNAETGEWRTVDQSSDELTVELTDDAAVSEAIVEVPLEGCDTETARVRATIDMERGVVTESTERLTIDGANEECDFSSDGVDIETEFDVETGTTVERPAELGRPNAAEWFWKLVAY